MLLIGAALLTSSLTAVFRDFGELLQPLMRLLFYVSSVVWAITGDTGSRFFPAFPARRKRRTSK